MSTWQADYPILHRSLAPEYRGLSAEQVTHVVHSTLGEAMTLADAEGFFDDVGRAFSNVARVAAPVAQRALPGVMSGAMSGAALGPWGMLGGAVLGGLGSALGGGGASPRPGGIPPVSGFGGMSGMPPIPHPPSPQPPFPMPSHAGVPPMPGGPQGFAPSFGGVGGPVGMPAITQLLGALGSPTVQQALMSMFLGRAGAPTAQTSTGHDVPVGAITNLLGMLAGRASAEWEEAFPSVESEAFAPEGLDNAAPEARGDWLYAQLAPVELEPLSGESDEAWLDELYDEIDASFVASTEASMDEAFDEAFDEAEVPSWEWATSG